MNNSLTSQTVLTLEDLSCKVCDLASLERTYDLEHEIESIKEFVFEEIDKQKTLRRGRRLRPKKEYSKHTLKHIRMEFNAIERCLHEAFQGFGIERTDLLKWSCNE